jgi:hypothetical protein
LNSLSIDSLSLHTFGPSSFAYLFVSFTDGTLAAFNFYPSSLKQLIANNADLSLTLFRLSNQFALGSVITEINQVSSSSLTVSTPENQWLINCSEGGALRCQAFSREISEAQFVRNLMEGDGSVVYSLMQDCKTIIVGRMGEMQNEIELKSTQVNGMVQKIEYIEELNLVGMCCFDSYFEDSTNMNCQQSQVIVNSTKSGSMVFSFSPNSNHEKPSAIKYQKYKDQHLLFVGTTVQTKNDTTTPDLGQVYIFKIKVHDLENE